MPKRYDSILSESNFKSKYSLQFINKKLEKSFHRMILSDVASTLGINYAEKNEGYVLSYYCVAILYISSYISTYFENKSQQNTLLLQILSLGSCIILNSMIYLLSWYYKINTEIKSFALILSYLLFSEIIVLNSCLFKVIIYNDPADYGFFSILGLLPVIYCSKFAVFSSFHTYFLINILISISYVITSALSNTNIQRIIIDFLFLFIILLIESRNFYIQESNIREKFLTVNQLLENEQKKILEDRSPKTDIEEISHAIKESIHLIPMIIQQKSKHQIYLEKIFDNLSKVMNLLGNRNSVYSIDMEGLDKNIDQEDKKFIEELCIAPKRSQARNSTKYLIRKTIEMFRDFELSELVGILKRIGKEWNFDMFFLKDCTKNKALSIVGLYSIQKYHLDTVFALQQPVCLKYFESLEETYIANPYHNSSHAADVFCSYIFLVQQSTFQSYLQDYELLASIIAILGHDVAHPGVNNRFLVNSKDPLAITCNLYIDSDCSVLEMMHSALTFQIMQKPNHNILQTLSNEIASIVRSLIIEMILATDMSKHFDIIGKFKAKIINSPHIPLNIIEQRHEVIKILTKASDVGHAAKSQELHRKWTNLICEEFYHQGDMEKQQDLPVSMYCDREKTDIAKSQAGFLKNIVLPIYESLNLCFCSESIKENCINQLDENIKMWESSLQIKRVMTISADNDEPKNFKSRTETTIAGRTARNSSNTFSNI